MKSRLVAIDIRRDVNEYGEKAYLVTPTYDYDGIAITVPDSKGWPTRVQAIREAERKCGVPAGTIKSE